MTRGLLPEARLDCLDYAKARVGAPGSKPLRAKAREAA